MALKRHQQAIATLDMSYVKQTSPELANLIARQDGIVTVEQLAQQGFDASTLYRRIKSAQWQRLLPTIILTSAGQPTRRQLLIGAALWGGPGCAIDGPDACAWYGLKVGHFDARRVYVVAPWDAPVRSRGFVVVRRACAEITVGESGRLDYVEPATALIVAARCAPSLGSAIDTLSRGLQIGLTNVDDLSRARQLIGDKWCRGVDGALIAVGVGVRSPAEKVNHDLILSSLV